jgi:hypothetical protein
MTEGAALFPSLTLESSIYAGGDQSRHNCGSAYHRSWSGGVECGGAQARSQHVDHFSFVPGHVSDWELREDCHRHGGVSAIRGEVASWTNFSGPVRGSSIHLLAWTPHLQMREYRCFPAQRTFVSRPVLCATLGRYSRLASRSAFRRSFGSTISISANGARALAAAADNGFQSVLLKNPYDSDPASSGGNGMKDKGSTSGASSAARRISMQISEARNCSARKVALKNRSPRERGSTPYHIRLGSYNMA